ncbi:type II secretion system protein [Candidatus Peregrinibacteria bacterium]|nr:type II secretion system protein [Candidatus Peregrinibacteria bacterium]
MKNTRLSKGFTLIELLIVITIIGILAVALLPSVLGAPARARDAARKADLNNIIAGLETYNSDNQDYPAAAAAGICVSAIANFGDYFQGGNIPNDPQSKDVGACTTGYFYCKLNGSPSSYLVASQMEIQGDGNAIEADFDGLSVCDGSGLAPAATAPTSANGPWAFVVEK